MDIGKSISEQRTVRHMSQQELADRLFVSRDLVAKWESGARRPDYAMIERIAEALETSTDSIVDINDYIFSELSECVLSDVDISPDRLTDTVNAFLGTVSEKDANIFLMRYYFLRGTPQIAEKYGISENQVRSRLSKIRSKLKSYMKGVLK